MSATSSSTLTGTTTSSPSPSSTNNVGAQSGPSSPLLFFVALGFGVVFTNLWIIVGVKYCFRYNQRNRARLNGDDPDAVDLAAMPQRRRRREKKLMTIEEVNEQFPLTKYKTWRSTRAEEGLPTAGGINAAPSRAASVKNMPRASEDEGRKSTSGAMSEKVSPSEPSSPIAMRHDRPIETESKSAVSETTAAQPADAAADATGADDQIQTAIPAEQLPDPGDTCAICIDALEDDDDIRGLTCGHAFHGSCVDPWLTSRRACCPLCKADYYVPKARPEGEAEEMQRRRMQEQASLANNAFVLGRRRRGPPMNLFTRHILGRAQPPNSRPSEASLNRRAREPSEATVGAGPEQTQEQRSWHSRINLPRLPAMSRIRGNAASQPGQQATTPAQLEAGQNR